MQFAFIEQFDNNGDDLPAYPEVITRRYKVLCDDLDELADLVSGFAGHQAEDYAHAAGLINFEYARFVHDSGSWKLALLSF